MNSFPKNIFFVCIVVAVSNSSNAVADDWPRWMGPQMDGVWRESGMIDEFPDDGLKDKWRIKIGAGYGGPSVAGGRVYVMDRTEDEGKGKEVENAIRKAGQIPGGERIMCLDAKSGMDLWSHTYDCPYKIAYPTGPRCTPTVDGDYVYTLGAMGNLICLKTANGEIVWEKKLLEEFETRPPAWGFSSHPLVDGDKLIVPVGGEGSAIVAFDKMTGKELWRKLTAIDVAYAPVRIFEQDGVRQLIFWHSDGINSLDPETGESHWFVKFPEERNMSQTSIATPRFIGNRILISEFYKGSLLLEVSANPPGVKELWRSYKTDPKHETALNSMMTTPVIKDGYVYGIAYDGKGQGVFRCLELDSGKMIWTKEDWMEDKPIVFATSFIVENDDKYFLFNDNGDLMIAKLSPDGFESLDRTRILDTTGRARGRKVVWSHPAFANGHIFARNDDEIVCIDLRKSDGQSSGSE